MPSSRNLAAFRALKSPPFRRFLWGAGLGAGARALQMTVIGFIVYDLTESDFLLGLLSFMQLAPVLLMAPIVGVIVDSYERRRILAIAMSIQAAGFLILGLFASLNTLTVPVIAAVVLVMGAAGAFTFPAQSALVPNLIERNALQSAVATNSILSNASRVLVPAVGGLLINAVSVTFVLLLGAGMYFPAALIILTVPLISHQSASLSRRPFEAGQTVHTFFSDLRDVVRYIRSETMLRASLLNDVIPFLFGMSAFALLPAIALDTLDGTASTLGLLLAISGAGAIVGTLTAAFLADVGRRGTVIWFSMIGWGLALILVGTGTGYGTILPGLVLAGFFQTLYIVQNDTLIQFFATDRFRGRVIAAQSMINALTTIGFLLIGTTSEIAGIAVAMSINGAALVGMGLITLLFRPAMRNLR